MLKTLATSLLLLSIASLGYAQEEQRQFLMIYPYKISVNDSLCYQVKESATAPWEPFCGEFDNFYFEPGYEYAVYVKEYNPHADTMFVIRPRLVGSWPNLEEKRMEEVYKEKERQTAIKRSFSWNRKAQYMTVYPYKVGWRKVLCYLIRPGRKERGAIPWEPFCGVFENFEFEEGKEHTLLVKKYDPSADTIHVVKIIK